MRKREEAKRMREIAGFGANADCRTTHHGDLERVTL